MLRRFAPLVLLVACEKQPDAAPQPDKSATTSEPTTANPEPTPPEPVPPIPPPADEFAIGPGKLPTLLAADQIAAPIPTDAPALDFWKLGDKACAPDHRLEGATPPNGTEIRCIDANYHWTGPEARFHPGEGEHLQMVGRRNDGKMVGVWLWFHPSGTKSAEHPYVDGELHGTMRRFAENGQEIEQGEYRAGRPWGLFVQHDATGKEIGRAQLKNGTGLLVLATESRRTESEYVDGLMHGKHREFDASGKLIAEADWSGGEPHGVETRWGPLGHKAIEEHWKQGQQHGLFTRWNQDGKLVEQSIWIDGNQRSRQLFLDDQPLAPLPATTPCDTNAGLSAYLATTRGRGLPDEHGCINRMPLFPGVVMMGSFAYDHGCMNPEWVVDCKLVTAAPTAAELLARAGWARANGEQRIEIASEWLRDFGLGYSGSIIHDPEKPEWTVKPDQSVEGVVWVAEPAGMQRGREMDKLRYTFAPDGTMTREVLQHVSTTD